MLVLGIETSCDETGVALYDGAEGRLLAHVVHSQVAMHEAYGGVVPELASRDHIRRPAPLTRPVLERSRHGMAELSGVGYTEGPGLPGALLVGASLGPALSRLAERGTPGRYHLPRPMLTSGDLDFSFSGLKTAALMLVKQQGNPADIARAFVDAVVEVLVAKCARALEANGLERLVVAGGVGANKQLRAALDAEAKKRGFDVFYPEPELCTDNGAMIAFAAAQRLGSEAAPQAHAFTVKPRWPL